MSSFDVIVAGLGVAGSATLSDLAGRGLRVLGLDQFSPPHTTGSSHGGSRIIREAYFEGSAYVPLVRRAYDLWHALEQETGRSLLSPTGGMTLGRRDGELVAGALASVRAHAIDHDVLSSGEVTRRFPEFRPAEDMVAVLEHRAGVLLPEASISALLDQAQSRGAQIRTGERIVEWSATPAGVEVTTPLGRYTAGQLVIAAGAWLPQLIGDVDLGLWVERQVMHWFGGAAGAAWSARSPVTIWEYEPNRVFYTIPDVGEGTKAAFHHAGERAAIGDIRRDVSAGEIAAVEQVVARHVPGLAPRALRSATCVYTNTPDQDFLIDRHPAHRNVVLASACSGHGFKFGPAVGEMVGRLVTGEMPEAPELFSARRLLA